MDQGVEHVVLYSFSHDVGVSGCEQIEEWSKQLGQIVETDLVINFAQFRNVNVRELEKETLRS